MQMTKLKANLIAFGMWCLIMLGLAEVVKAIWG